MLNFLFSTFITYICLIIYFSYRMYTRRRIYNFVVVVVVSCVWRSYTHRTHCLIMNKFVFTRRICVYRGNVNINIMLYFIYVEKKYNECVLAGSCDCVCMKVNICILLLYTHVYARSMFVVFVLGLRFSIRRKRVNNLCTYNN